MKQNSMSFKLGCEVFDAFNGTHNNTVAHFSFGETNNWGYEATQFDDKYSKTHVTANRTDSNDQHFNLTMGETVDFLQVQSHLLYTSREGGKPCTRSFKDGAGFEGFIAEAGTSSIFKTGPMVVSREIFPAAELAAAPEKIIEVGQ